MLEWRLKPLSLFLLFTYIAKAYIVKGTAQKQCVFIFKSLHLRWTAVVAGVFPPLAR